jgi:CHAT domain-containing protein
LGDFYNELEAAYQEQIVYPKLGASTERIRPLIDIACALHDVGSDDIALEFAIEALGKSETMRTDSRLPYQIHICLGLIYEGLEAYSESVRHFRLATELVPVDNFWGRNIAVCHGHLGRTLIKLRRFNEASEHLNKQLSIASRAGYDREVCYAEAYMGLLYQAQGKNQLARDLLERAYELSSRLGQLPSILICARGLSMLAESDHRLGAAVVWREKAIATTESMGLWHERLISLGCIDRELLRDYHEYVRLLCAIRRPDRAFEAAERAKALSFTKLVNIPQVEKNLSGTDPIRTRLLSLQQEIINLHCLLAAEKAPLVPANSAHSSLSLISRLNHLEMSFQRTLDTLRSYNDRFFSVLKPSVYSAREIQESLLNPRTALIEFVVGEKSTSVIVVGKDTIGSYEVDISDRNLKQLMSRISRVLTDGKSRIPIMNAAIADFNTDALHNAFQLLIRSALPFVKDADHLTIVSDGVLLNLPFELMVTGREMRNNTRHGHDPAFLIEEFEVNYALSATQALRARYNVHRAGKTMLAIGDAVAMSARTESSGYSEGEYASVMPQKYSPSFPGVRRELAAIRRIFGERSDILSQAEATPGAFQTEAPDYRILHIAAHVEFDETRPLYSLIVLSPDRLRPQAGGLRAINFLSMELNAELVVLSGCNTGRVSPGTDQSGMTSSIVLSGVPTVVASLWNVDDEVTAQLMESFYSYLTSGHTKGESLRMAKLDMMRGGRSDPFYWGAFVLCGDGGQIALDAEPLQPNNAAVGVYAIVGSLILLLCGVVLFRKHRTIRSDSQV